MLAQLWLWIVATVILGLDEHRDIMLGISLGAAAGLLLLPFVPMLLPQIWRDTMSHWVSLCSFKRKKDDIYPGRGEGHVPLPQGVSHR